MSVIVHMRDSLLQDELDCDFETCLAGLNQAVSSGKTFCAFDDVNGNKIMLNMPSILTIRETDEERSED